MGRSGKYQNLENPNEYIKLDIDGIDPLLVISGTIFNKYSENTHWLAKVVSINEYGFHADISHVRGYKDNFRFRTITGDWSHSGEVKVSFNLESIQEYKKYKQINQKFRSIEFTFDREQGINPVTRIDPTAHPNHSTALNDELMSIEDVFDKVGIEVKVKEERDPIPMMETDSHYSWSDGELHDAMRFYWERYKEEPQWAMWVFFASIHDRGKSLKGKMFDNIGEHHRQGVAIFNHAIESDVPDGEGKYSEDWIKRRKFWATCHEIGHGLNLTHSWQREATNSWMPLKNEVDVATFMNYPSKYNEVRETNYFRDFQYRFSNSELMFIRHAPEYYIRMGDAKWLRSEGFASFEENKDFKVDVNLNQTLFEFLEPVNIEIKLTNISCNFKLIPDDILRNQDFVSIVVQKDGLEPVLFESFVQECHSSNKIRLESDLSQPDLSYMKESALISAGKDGWLISEPGRYTIYVAFYWENKIKLSEPVNIRVLYPQSKDEEKLAQDHFTDETARVLFFRGSKLLNKTNDHLHEVRDQLPYLRVSIHAEIALSIPYSFRYKIFDDDFNRITLSKPDDSFAESYLNRALSKPESKLTLGKIDHDYYTGVLHQIRERLD